MLTSTYLALALANAKEQARRMLDIERKKKSGSISQEMKTRQNIKK
jgi:hypothetical protein